jgi:hypothetical protein
VKEKLRSDRQLLEKQRFWLDYSIRECREIGIRPHYDPEQFGKFETLCARYARGIDFLVRKLYRTIDLFEFENQGTLIDVVNRAHKRGLVDSVETLRLMKDLRNDIVHEYIEESLPALFGDVLENAQELLALFDRATDYIERLLEKG